VRWSRLGVFNKIWIKSPITQPEMPERTHGGGALRQQPLAIAGRREAFGCARTLLDFGIGRARPLLESARTRRRVNPLCAFSRAREGGPLGQRFRSGGAGSELSGRQRHDPIETAGRGDPSVNRSLSHFTRARGAPTRRVRLADRPARAAWAALRLLADVADFFLVLHRALPDLQRMKLCYSAAASSAPRSVFSWCDLARLLVGPGVP
jgi:hypothetical protein